MSAYRVTAKQQSYADNRLGGMNQIDALRNSLYKTDSMSQGALRVMAHRLENHPNIKLTMEAGRAKVSRRVEYGLERAVEMAMEDWAQAKELGQIGAAVSSNRLAADLMGLLVDRRRDLTPDEDPIARLMGDIAGKSRIKPETRH